MKKDKQSPVEIGENVVFLSSMVVVVMLALLMLFGIPALAALGKAH
jgi:hypothetical protein